MIYFGTDGIRGTVGEDITQEIAFRCGNSLASLKPNLKIVVATDTRTSADFLFTSFASGATMAGASIVFVGVAPTPVVSFLTRELKADFGVMITASHNPPCDNGIKIFNENGEKIDLKTQTQIERGFAKQKMTKVLRLGKIVYKPKLLNKYIKFVTKNCPKLDGLKVVLDLSNGASSKTAYKIFKKLDASVTKINFSKNGRVVNKNCGALHPEGLAKEVVKQKADVGFAFDGDADRVVMIDEQGNVCNGDQILIYLANMYKKYNLLHTDAVVGTILSNFALEKELKKINLKLIRTDVGDHNVEKELCIKKLQIGGEQAGHIILFDYERTGDGVFCATQICKFIKLSKTSISKSIFKNFVPQYTKNIKTDKKFEIVNSLQYKNAVDECEKMIKNKGRIVTRASGTENIVRIMIECEDENIIKTIFEKLEKVCTEI